MYFLLGRPKTHSILLKLSFPLTASSFY
uniref:Uncharacterized protein n=1 Tax=Arundo donax TaxID=35708 RepID=A0A0A9FR70_ARUDO